MINDYAGIKNLITKCQISLSYTECSNESIHYSNNFSTKILKNKNYDSRIFRNIELIRIDR
jgi:hypothetical protein